MRNLSIDVIDLGPVASDFKVTHVFDFHALAVIVEEAVVT